MNHWQLLRATVRAWYEDDAPRMAAALAYYAITSIAPLLLIALGVANFVLGTQAARGELLPRLEILVGPGPAEAIEKILGNINVLGDNGFFTGINIVVFLFGSIWVFTALQDALNCIWRVPPRAGVSRILRMRGRLLLFALVLVTGVLLLMILAASVTLTTLTGFLEASGFATWLLHGANVGISFVLVTFVFALIYKFLPEAHVQWRHVWGGALGSSLLHSLGNYAIGLYVGHSLLTSIYGAASSVMVILLWVYYSSLGFLLGAEYVHKRGEEQNAQLTEAERHVRELKAQLEAATSALAQAKALGSAARASPS
jgi:membrane protein